MLCPCCKRPVIRLTRIQERITTVITTRVITSRQELFNLVYRENNFKTVYQRQQKFHSFRSNICHFKHHLKKNGWELLERPFRFKKLENEEVSLVPDSKYVQLKNIRIQDKTS